MHFEREGNFSDSHQRMNNMILEYIPIKAEYKHIKKYCSFAHTFILSTDKSLESNYYHNLEPWKQYNF